MLLYAHSGLRYLVLLAGLAVVVYATYGIVTGRAYDRRIRVLSAAFTGLIDVTAMFGLAQLFTGRFYPQLGGHVAMLVFAAIVAHIVYGVMKRRPPDQQTYVPHLVGALVVLGLVAGGVLALGRPVVG